MTSERRRSELLFLYRITSSAVRVGVFRGAELLDTLCNRRVRKPHRRGAEWRWDSPWHVKSTTLKTVLLLEKQQNFMYVCIYLSHVNYLTPPRASQNKTHQGCCILQKLCFAGWLEWLVLSSKKGNVGSVLVKHPCCHKVWIKVYLGSVSFRGMSK